MQQLKNADIYLMYPVLVSRLFKSTLEVVIKMYLQREDTKGKYISPTLTNCRNQDFRVWRWYEVCDHLNCSAWAVLSSVKGKVFFDFAI